MQKERYSMKNIVLIGMMGCGKTTIGKLLEKRLNRKMIDIDEYIEKKYHMSISQMFEISQDYFRKRETICCKELASLDGYIISTGGGVVCNQENMDALKKNAIVFYLDRPVENIIGDIDVASRPLLKDGTNKLYELYKQRHALYIKACDYHIINNGDIDKVIENIISYI